MTGNGLQQSRKTVLFEDFKLGVLRRVFTCVGVAFFFSVPLMMSTLGRTVGFFLLIEILILLVWYPLACRRVTKSHKAQERRTVNLEKMGRAVNVAWAVFALFVVVATVATVLLHPHGAPQNIYDWLVLAGDYVSPVLAFTVPAVFNCILSSARDTTDSEDENERRRRHSHLGLVAVLVVAFLASYAMLFFATPEISKYSPNYLANQQNVLSHDISAVTDLKNTDDVSLLFGKLPASEKLKSVTEENNALTVVYDGVEEDDVKRLCVYNATAATALLDRMESVTVTVNGQSYTCSAEKITAFYTNFTKLLTTTVWRSDVTAPLSDETETARRFDVFFADEEPQNVTPAQSDANEETDKPEEPSPVYLTFAPDCRVNEGFLILVNYDNPFDGEDATTFVNLRTLFEEANFKYESDAYLNATAAAALCEMIKDFDDNSGVEDKTIRINSSYRSKASQQALYDEYLDKYGIEYVEQYVALPGYSEHQTGLAVDLTNSKYLAANCHRFGFVRRYQEDKIDVTRTANEKWHYRYVGVPVATYMTEQSLCLEEFIENARSATQDAPICFTVGGVAYNVFYLPQGESVTVEEGTEVAFSGDNVDGYIVITK